MMTLARRLCLVILGVSAVLGPWSAAAQAQVRSPLNPAGVGPLAPFGVGHPFANAAALGRNVLGNTFGLGAGLGYGSGLNNGLGYGSLIASNPNSPAGYAALLNGYGAGGYGITGSLLNSAAAGYGYGMGYGMGYGTQWMMNPYEGYLTGAASVTRANAEYQLTIQQAKLVRQEAVRSAIQTRRAWIEEAEYERAHMPDPEKIRQEQLRRELDHARVSPPLTEVWSGHALNVLLRHLVNQFGQGVRVTEDVPLSEDALKSVNLTAGDSRANAGLLKDANGLQWPQPLQAAIFKDTRDDLNKNLRRAVQTVRSGNTTADPATLNDLDADLKKMHEILDANISAISPDHYIEAKRYLRQVGDAIAALKDRNATNIISGNWSIGKARTVAELVKQMADKGLMFAAATPGDESSYLSLYHSLAAFDARMARVAGTGGAPPVGPDANK